MRFASAILPALGFAVLSFAPAASAQCNMYSSAFMDIGLVPGNPFSAERATSRAGAIPIFANSPFEHAQLIARDSQGRVRIERVTGKYKMDSGPDQGQELDQHLVLICDPVSQTLTQIDTLNRTAKITHSGPAAALPLNFNVSQSSLCASKSKTFNFAGARVDDLGHQNIQGFDSQGFRFTITPAITPADGHTASISIREEWCSEELSAVVLQSMSSMRDGRTNIKTDITLSKIERVEPPAALFQIPPDYTISELVPNPPTRRPGFVPSVPNAPAEAPTSPL